MRIEPEKFYTLKDLHNFLFSARTWERRVRNGDVTYLKTGVILIKGEWLLEYINKNTQKAIERAAE